jgi:predicted O-methyltransferase YrrM
MASPLNDPKLKALLNRLHAQSDAQVHETDAYFTRREQESTLDQENFYNDDMHRFLSDKMVALDRDKAEFCYLLCRSLRAARVVEVGTSFGISTLYLAAAVRDNQVENGVVIGTEYEPKKVEVARANFKEAGLSEFIELREGDLR